MSGVEPDPSTGLLLVAGGSSCLIVFAGFFILAAVLLFTMFGPDFFPERWPVALGCGLLPALVATPAFLVGLRQHDLGRRKKALKAFAVSWLCLPCVIAGGAYLVERWHP